MPVDFNLFNGTPLCNVKLIIDEEYLSNGRKNSGGDVIAKLMPGTGVMGGFRPGGTKSLILSILVDTFVSKISLTMQPGPKIDSISGA